MENHLHKPNKQRLLWKFCAICGRFPEQHPQVLKSANKRKSPKKKKVGKKEWR